MVTDQQIRDFAAKCAELQAEMDRDPSKRVQQLIRAGILTKGGKLRTHYRRLKFLIPKT